MYTNIIFEAVANEGFKTPLSLDSYIVDLFNNLGWWGNLILLVLSLFSATLFGGILGYQREANGHAAGFRTHVLISLGSALIMLLSIYVIPGEAPRDPMRLAAAGVTGVGFLGAGSIIKNGITIKGLTTSATIWVTMAIGMACGAGFFVMATLTTIIALAALITFKHIETWISRNNTNLIIVVNQNCPVFKDLIALLDKYEISYKDFDTTLVDANGMEVLRIQFKCSGKKEIIYSFIEEFKYKVNPIDISVVK